MIGNLSHHFENEKFFFVRQGLKDIESYPLLNHYYD